MTTGRQSETRVQMCCCTTSWTDVLTALGTVGAVLVALFGQFLPRLFTPQLQLTKSDSNGVRQRVQVVTTRGVIPAPREGLGRYYQLEVSNARRWTKAHNVRVMLLKLEAETVAGWIESWGGGGIPLQWQHQNALGSTRTLGPPALADLFNVLRLDGAPPVTQLGLTPIFGPLGVELNYAGACGLRVTLQAQSDETDSDRFVVTLRWDGHWEDGAMEMAQHVRWTIERA
jgi:hypothetical protein